MDWSFNGGMRWVWEGREMGRRWEWWVMNDEWWMMSDEWWVMNDEWWMMSDELRGSWMGFSWCQRTRFLEFRCKGTNFFRGVRCLAVFSGGFRAIMVFNGELNELLEGYVGYYLTANWTNLAKWCGRRSSAGELLEFWSAKWMSQVPFWNKEALQMGWRVDFLRRWYVRQVGRKVSERGVSCHLWGPKRAFFDANCPNMRDNKAGDGC